MSAYTDLHNELESTRIKREDEYKATIDNQKSTYESTISTMREEYERTLKELKDHHQREFETTVNELKVIFIDIVNARLNCTICRRIMKGS